MPKCLNIGNFYYARYTFLHGKLFMEISFFVNVSFVFTKASQVPILLLTRCIFELVMVPGSM